jgi:sulfur-oxidizing protein SoxZ
MGTGYRTDEAGRPIARNAIRTLTCRYGGETVFAAQPSPGIAASPYLRVFVTARESGALAFNWVEDSGARGSEQVVVTVVGSS